MELPKTILSASEVEYFLLVAGVTKSALVAQPADREYALISYDWYVNVFANAWRETMRKLGIADFADEANDCDDFAKMCSAYAGMLNHRTLRELAAIKGNKLPYALAFNEIWYDPSSGGRHAICWFMWSDNTPPETVYKRVKVAFIEPQTGNFLNLTKSEITSSTFCRR